MSDVKFGEEVVEVFNFVFELAFANEAEALLKIKQEYLVVSFLYAMHMKYYEQAVFLARVMQNPNLKTHYGIPIAEAIKHKKINIIDALLENNAFVDINDLDGTPLLTLSVQTDNFSIFGKILMKEPNVFAEDKNGISCLKHILAASEKNSDIEDVFRAYVDGMVEKKFIQAVDDCDLKALKEIFPRYINVISQENIFKAIKFFIISKYNKQASFALIHFLFPYLDNPNYVDEQGFSILHYACIKDKIDIIKLLTIMGASLLVKDEQGLLPYEILSKLGFDNSSKIIKFLTDKEIDKS